MKWSWRSRLAIVRDSAFLLVNVPIRLGVILFLLGFELALVFLTYDSLSRLWEPAFEGTVFDVLETAFPIGMLTLIVLVGLVTAALESWHATVDEFDDVQRGVEDYNEMSERAASQAGDISLSAGDDARGAVTDARAPRDGITLADEVQEAHHVQ